MEQLKSFSRAGRHKCQLYFSGVFCKQSCFLTQNGVPVADDRESDPLGASQAASFFEGYEHRDVDYQSSAPPSSSSKPRGDSQAFESPEENAVSAHEDVVSTKSDSTASFQQQASWPSTYQPQDSLSTPMTGPNDEYKPQMSYSDSYQSEQEQNRFDQTGQGDTFGFYQQPQEGADMYGQQPQFFQPDQMDMSGYQDQRPPVYTPPGEMTGLIPWGIQPQEEPASEGACLE